MTDMLKRLGSTRLTLLGFGALGLTLFAREMFGVPASWWVIMLLGVLALNLAAALIVRPRLRQETGLFIFHLALLALLILAGIGRLTHFDGHIEVMEGNAFSAREVVVDSRGPLHPDWLPSVNFHQGPFSVDYAPGVRRARTRTQIVVQTESGTEVRALGDGVAFVARGFRFYTTHNKGIAVVLTWLPTNGEAITGAVHMPGYPLFDWKQDNRWQPPNGPDIRFWLHLSTPLQDDRAWTLSSDHVTGTLVVNTQGRRIELMRGESVRFGGGELRFDELRGWMGYRIFFDPTLPWLFGSAIVAVIGLALQFWQQSRRLERGVVGVWLSAKGAR